MLPKVEGPKGSADAVLSGPKLVSDKLQKQTQSSIGCQLVLAQGHATLNLDAWCSRPAAIDWDLVKSYAYLER